MGDAEARPHRAVTITVTIDRPAGEVYDYVRDPGNLPEWSFFEEVVERDGRSVATWEGTEHEVVMTERNDLGVVDHLVRLPSSEEVRVPMRVVDNARGAEVLFTLFQTPDMSDDRFATDADFVRQDLDRLRAILESPSA